jgi:hypothetical protein
MAHAEANCRTVGVIAGNIKQHTVASPLLFPDLRKGCAKMHTAERMVVLFDTATVRWRRKRPRRVMAHSLHVAV